MAESAGGKEPKGARVQLDLSEERLARAQDVPEGYQLLQASEHTPFLHYIGPLFYRREGDDLVVAARAEPWDRNGMGFAHGGFMMSLADFTLCSAAMDSATQGAVTVSFNAEFLNPAPGGSLLECHAREMRRATDLSFVRGEVRAGKRVVLAFSGVVKRMGEKRDTGKRGPEKAQKA